MNNVTRAIIYSRVSTDAQERDGTSLETQERACVEFVQASGWRVIECIRDSASGYSLDRPGIERLRQLLRQGVADVVIAYAVDRVSRNQNHIGVLFDEVQQAEARLEFVTEKFEDTAVGRFILAARAFVAEVEREKIVERTMRGKAERARSGRIPQGTGKGIYGYTYDRETGRRSLSPTQAPVVQRIFSEFLGGKTVMAIANGLNQEGSVSFEGGIWYAPTVYRMLRNETYTGHTVYRRTTVRLVRNQKTGKRQRKVELREADSWIEVPDATPSIVDAGVYSRVQTMLDDPERRRRARRVHDYVLSGRTKCLVCGRAVVGQTVNKSYRYYRCRRAFAGPWHDRCDSRYVSADKLEQAVREEISSILSQPERVLMEIKRAASRQGEIADPVELRRQIDSLDQQRMRLVKLYQLGEIDDAYFRSESYGIRLKIEDIEHRLQPREKPLLMASPAALRKACDLIRARLETAEGDRFSLMLEALQVELRVQHDGGQISGIIPSIDYAPQNGDADVRSMVTKSASALPLVVGGMAGT
ncbi:MAG: recombinase family protein [Dehalococcoidia bacterium]|nr:recombinase family protein [Dehalococcoidia bacterium]